MAKDNKGGADEATGGSTNCKAEGCKKKNTRAQFCEEHFRWFKEGLLTREGQRPSDFDKKYQAFLSRQKTTA